MAFSSGVKLEDISDYIGVAQDCIITKPSSEQKDGALQIDTGIVEIQKPRASGGGGHFDQIRTNQKSQTASITLDDCLACVGCVTSAETVLIQQQSSEEFLSQSRSSPADTVIVVTVSPQSRVSLAQRFGLSELEMAKKLTSYFKSLRNVKYVFDSNSALDFSLIEAREEFVKRFKSNGKMPILCSECPGWICYAEKSVGSHILPYLSAVKSPQAVMGALVKGYLAKKLGVSRTSIYHTTIMPCYDKKLEAARKEFFDKETNSKDVDCVLSSLEVADMLSSVDVTSLSSSPLDSCFSNVSSDQSSLYGATDRGASGGYLENIFRYAAKELFGQEIPDSQPLTYKRGRNNDFQEVSLQVDGKKVLRFVAAYGFRNIQKITRQIKTGTCKYHFVEIMACPSGCLNGGGQVKIEEKNIKAQRALIETLDKSFHERQVRRSEDSPIVKEVYDNWIRAGPGSAGAQTVFHTTFNAIKTEEATTITW